MSIVQPVVQYDAGQFEGARARTHTHTHTHTLQANEVCKTNNSVDIVRWQCTATNKRVLFYLTTIVLSLPTVCVGNRLSGLCYCNKPTTGRENIFHIK
jgi:hypothetical protein